ncbi:hypothetical protein DL240_06875 [Lujinxingia litoralis]|uniref:HEAT repeat domain-containing protein n=1 Tax=Lujinxingia litoralis TaxID=2211119 RepID=A0A328C955_9DELT|nr:hypothetical protein [Lujinxingia litoralis]RAL23866.1 hypothetical protein DL240_06875 [Lujinxingia litoralis]
MRSYLYAPLRRALALLLVAALLLTAACQRSPEDLEVWRTSKGGTDQLAAWAESPEEPMEVRVRAVQILIEEGDHARVPRVLEQTNDAAARQAMADGAMPTIEAMWQQQDIPELTDEMREKGAELVVGDSQSTRAKDAAYALYDYFSDETKPRAQAIFKGWLEKDLELRNQLGDATVAQIVPLAGPGAVDLVAPWLKTTFLPGKVATAMRASLPKEDQGPIDAALAERAREEHPELKRDLPQAVFNANTDQAASYYEFAIFDPNTSAEYLQGAMEALARVKGKDSAPTFQKVIQERPGMLRWVAANYIVDTHKRDSLPLIASALPTTTEGWDLPSDDSFERASHQVCSLYKGTMEREKITDFQPVVAQLLTIDSWSAKTLGVVCAGTLKLTGLAEQVAALSTERQRLPGWGSRTTLGQLARQTADELK